MWQRARTGQTGLDSWWEPDSALVSGAEESSSILVFWSPFVACFSVLLFAGEVAFEGRRLLAYGEVSRATSPLEVMFFSRASVPLAVVPCNISPPCLFSIVNASGGACLRDRVTGAMCFVWTMDPVRLLERAFLVWGVSFTTSGVVRNVILLLRPRSIEGRISSFSSSTDEGRFLVFMGNFGEFASSI